MQIVKELSLLGGAGGIFLGAISRASPPVFLASITLLNFKVVIYQSTLM